MLQLCKECQQRWLTYNHNERVLNPVADYHNELVSKTATREEAATTMNHCLGNESEGITEAEALGEELLDAVRGHDDSTVRELLVLGADPNMRVTTENGPRSILNEAIAENHAPCVVVLLEGGANVNEGGARGVTPLKVVVGQNYAALVEPICKAPGIDSDIIDASLVMACQLGSKESAFMLLKCGADPANLTVLGDESRTALHNCSAKGDDDGFDGVPLAQALLEAGAPLENGLPVHTGVMAGCTPLVIACVTGALKLVQLYSSYGAKRAPPDAHFTASTAGTDGVQAWLQESADWSTPLHHASVVPIERTRALLRAGADLHAQARPGAPTPLELAEQSREHPGSQLVLAASLPWSPDTHALMPAMARARAVELMRLGHLLALQPGRFGTASQALVHVWRDLVLSHAIVR